MPSPTLLIDCYCENAEGPMWHPDENRLYWTDIPAGKIFRYDFGTQEYEPIYQGEPVGGFTFQEDGSLLLFMARGAIARWHNGSLTTIIPEIEEERDTRFNDVIADPEGRVFAGTMSTPDRKGNLYRFNTDRSLTKIMGGLGVPNGMGFTPDRQQFYCTDSDAKEIYRFDYDRTTGNIRNQRVHLAPDEAGVPDGMTVDAEGYIWSARWDGRHLFRYAPDGTEVMRIPFPAQKVTSVTFGGADYTDMFVTTAGGTDRAQEGAGAGAIFHLNLGIQGVPEFRSRILLF